MSRSDPSEISCLYRKKHSNVSNSNLGLVKEAFIISLERIFSSFANNLDALAFNAEDKEEEEGEKSFE